MRVAVLVHNDVVSDARVRKEVRTLVQAGHEVDVFGLAKPKTANSYPPSVEGSKCLQLIEISFPAAELRKRILSVVYKIVTLLSIALVTSLLIFASNQFLLDTVAIALPALMLCFNEFSRPKSAVSPPTRNLSFLVPVAAIAIGLLLRWLTEHEHIDWEVLTGAMVLTATLWFSGLRISDVKGYLAKAFSQPEAKALQIRFHQLASLLQSRVAQRNYDVIHCHDIIALIAGAAIKKEHPRTKLVWDAHEIYEDLAQGSPHVGQLNRKLILDRQHLVDGFVTISESFAAFYAHNYRLPKAHVVMNATRGREVATDDGRLRSAAKLDPDRRILLYQGGFARQRGIEILVKAAKDLPEPWSIVAMGWGALDQYLKNAAHKLAQGKPLQKAPLVVIPPASQEDLASWTAGATIGIIPYENTGKNHLYCTPNKLWEFPNAGVPILATDLVEMGQMIRTWDTGFLLPRDFSARDIVAFLGSVQDSDIEKKATKLSSILGRDVVEQVRASAPQFVRRDRNAIPEFVAGKPH